jgi:hypothetical protein
LAEETRTDLVSAGKGAGRGGNGYPDDRSILDLNDLVGVRQRGAAVGDDHDGQGGPHTPVDLLL